MVFKSISIVLFGLALCCFLQGTIAAGDTCQLKLLISPRYPDIYTIKSGEGSFTSPIVGGETGSTWPNLASFMALGKLSSYCDYCTMKVFAGKNFTGTNQVIDFRTKVGDSSQIAWSFDAYSYTLECFPPEPEEEEEESQEEIDWEEEEGDQDGEYNDAVFQQMNEGDGSTLPHSLVEMRHEGFSQAIYRLVSEKSVLPEGNYTSERVFSTEFATNYEGFYRFNVQIRDESGVEYRIWYTAYSRTKDYENYQTVVVDAGYKENRISEFSQTQFKVLDPVEESQENYPATVQDLGIKSVNQAAVRLQAKGIIPQGNYSIFIPFYYFDSIEHSAIVNMTEYPNHDDMLYRFNGRVVDQSGAIFRVWTVVATNYETPENYELIDYAYKQSRLAEFTNTDWREMNEAEDEPLSDELVQMRSRSVAQAIPRLQAEGALPEGKYTITKTYVTEFSGYFDNPNIPFYHDDTLYRFNVQLVNEAGARFRVAVVILNNGRWNEPKYELIDYFYVENRLDEFANTNFRSLDVDDLQTESINQAVDHLQSKSVLPRSTYTISKTFPAEFSVNFEHPDYSTDDYILYKFTALVKNAAKTEYKVYAIVITAYDAPQDFELIDYGEINA